MSDLGMPCINLGEMPRRERARFGLGTRHRDSLMTTFTESEVEDAALEWLGELGWKVAHGPHIAPHAANSERVDYTEVILEQRLRDALARLNPTLPAEAVEDALRKLIRPDGSTLETRNRRFHRMLVDGVTVEYRTAHGPLRGAQVSILDYENPANNDWLAVNQFTVVEGEHERRPDVVLFVNGLPLGLIELKNPADEKATVWTAWSADPDLQGRALGPVRLQRGAHCFRRSRSALGHAHRGAGVVQAVAYDRRRATLADSHLLQLQVMLEGMCERERFLTLVRDFIVFEDDGGGKLAKKMAGYHQFHAVETAVLETLRAAALLAGTAGGSPSRAGRYENGRQPGGDPGDRRIGVVWHTQGSGKSLTMAFYAGRIIREPAMENPTIVVLTDRNDLDDQLFGTFSRCQDLLRQPPTQARSRADLRVKLAVESGGVVFTTIQKFFPEEKGDRHARVVEAPEHRGDRRRGAPQPVRLHRRLRPPHAGRTPQRVVHRLHRHAHRAGGREYARGVRRLHQRLRHRAGRRGPRNGPDLLREPVGEARHWTRPSDRRSIPNSRR